MEGNDPPEKWKWKRSASERKFRVPAAVSKPALVHRGSALSISMAATVQTIRTKDLSAGLGYIYKKSSEWGSKFPDANGESQSPIDINSREAQHDDTLNDNPLTLNYLLCRETDIFNNGHTIVSYLRYKPALAGGPLPQGALYELSEFRFHWGREDARGSEHTVNLKAFPMELHLIHYNCTQYGSLEEAVGKPDGVAIVALFIQVVHENSGLKILTDQLEDIQYKGRQKTITSPFNPNCLVPDPMLRDFWTYPGSLTSPPCSENVTWILFRYPLTVSHFQMEEFRRLRTHPKGEAPGKGEDGQLVDNFRPTQPLNDRVVRASFPQ